MQLPQVFSSSTKLNLQNWHVIKTVVCIQQGMCCTFVMFQGHSYQRFWCSVPSKFVQSRLHNTSSSQTAIPLAKERRRQRFCRITFREEIVWFLYSETFVSALADVLPSEITIFQLGHLEILPCRQHYLIICGEKSRDIQKQ